jgi:ferredoxin-NADP reductase
MYSFQKKRLHASKESISPSNSDSDVEKQPVVFPPLSNTSLTIHQGRPDVATIITETVAGADKHDRVVVAVCGPGGMMQDARNSVAENIKVDGPSLELHSEHFGR